MKFRPVAAELFLADVWIDRQTDMTKLIVDFRNFANAHKCIYILILLRKLYSVLEILKFPPSNQTSFDFVITKFVCIKL
jgi:hypothetical protein